MSAWDNFTLGLSGIRDAVTGGHHAADTYAEQVARGGESASKSLDAMAPGTVKTETARHAATVAEDNGALATAGRQTFDQVAAKVTKVGRLVPWLIGAAVVVVAGVVVLVYAPRPRGAA